jgi:DNA-binding Lrp family transcriptional regulator
MGSKPTSSCRLTRGKADRVVHEARTVPGTTAADVVTGPYDIIARARASSLEDLQRRIVPRMQAMDGIIRVLLSPVAHG